MNANRWELYSTDPRQISTKEMMLKSISRRNILLIVCLLIDYQIPALASCALSILVYFSEIQDKYGSEVIHWYWQNSQLQNNLLVLTPKITIICMVVARKNLQSNSNKMFERSTVQMQSKFQSNNTLLDQTSLCHVPITKVFFSPNSWPAWKF